MQLLFGPTSEVVAAGLAAEATDSMSQSEDDENNSAAD